jgi:hypothetical protein
MQNTPAKSIAGGDKSDVTLVKKPVITPIAIGIAKTPDENKTITVIMPMKNSRNTTLITTNRKRVLT